MSPATPARTALDIADDTYIVAAAATVAEVVRDPASWAAWWPDLDLTVTDERGSKGVRWSVTGAVRGSMEIWLEPTADGVMLHWYLRADPARATRRSDRERARRVLRWKAQVHALKDRLEAGREPGSSPVDARAERDAGVKESAEPAESQ